MVLKPLTLLVPSTITALPAETVPGVTSSIVSSSFSEIFALPIIKEPLAVISPVLVMLPEFTVPRPETFPFVSNVKLPSENEPVITKLSLIVTVFVDKSPYIKGVLVLLLSIYNLLFTLPDAGPASLPINIFPDPVTLVAPAL